MIPNSNLGINSTSGRRFFYLKFFFYLKIQTPWYPGVLAHCILNSQNFPGFLSPPFYPIEWSRRSQLSENGGGGGDGAGRRKKKKKTKNLQNKLKHKNTNTVLISGPPVGAAQILIWSYSCMSLPPVSTTFGTSVFCESSQWPFGEGNGNSFQYSFLENYMDRQ